MATLPSAAKTASELALLAPGATGHALVFSGDEARRVPIVQLADDVPAERYGALGNGTHDDTQAIADACAAAASEGRRVRLDADKTYLVTQPITAYDGMSIVGTQRGLSKGVTLPGNTRIIAPGGFIVAPTRMRIGLEALHILGPGAGGQGTAAAVGIDGPLGGLYRHLVVDGYQWGVRNGYAYVSDYERCYIRWCDYGIGLREANQTNIAHCLFDRCGWAIDQMDLPNWGGSPTASAPLNIYNNLFSHNTIGPTRVRVSMFVSLRENYFELYSDLPDGQALVEYVSNPFAHTPFHMYGNWMPAFGRADHALRIYSETTAPSRQDGLVTQNGGRGYRQMPVVFAPPPGSSGRGAIVHGIDVHANGLAKTGDAAYSAPYVEYADPRSRARPIMVGAYGPPSPFFDTGGTSYQIIPLTTSADDHRGPALSNGVFVAARRGLYRLSGYIDVMLPAGTGDARAVEMRVMQGSRVIRHNALSIVRPDGPQEAYYEPQAISEVLAVGQGGNVWVEMRGGAGVRRARLALEFLQMDD